LADVEANLGGRQYGALSEGYKTALDTALREAQLEREAATTQGNLAKTAQELGLGEVGALSKAGTERQAYEQAMIDAPLKAAQAAQGLLRGFTIPTGDVSTVVGPGQAGQYGLSDLQKTMGLLSAIGALTAPGVGTGSTTTQGVQGAQANAGLDYLLSGIRRMLPSVAPTYFQDAAGNWMSGDVTSETPPI
jgi:hypothetical protein